jgi:predicted RNA-binding Zn-ribbon protein involved in translation (DUF1610 family)
MSVIQSVKETLGLNETKPNYECDSCGNEFHSSTEAGSYWFECPKCGADDATRID